MSRIDAGLLGPDSSPVKRQPSLKVTPPNTHTRRRWEVHLTSTSHTNATLCAQLQNLLDITVFLCKSAQCKATPKCNLYIPGFVLKVRIQHAWQVKSMSRGQAQEIQLALESTTSGPLALAAEPGAVEKRGKTGGRPVAG